MGDDIPDEIFEAATLAGKEAMRAYFDEHPEPKDLDFRCPACGMPPGFPCFFRRRSRMAGNETHLTRQRRSEIAFNRRQGNAVQASDDAFNTYVRQWRE